jgi:plastocyanin
MRARSLAARIAVAAAAALLAAPIVALAGPSRERATGARMTTSSTTGAGIDTGVRLSPKTVSAIHRGLSVHAASTTTVDISSFKFKPSSVTVKVGDTVTWVNHDSTPHTATKSGTFDTGSLAKGQSGSHTFSTAGTYNYICSFHPFMKASVTVTGSSSGGGGSNGTSGGTPSGSNSSGSNGNSNGSSPSGSGSSGTSSSPLPHTGLEIISLLVTGLALLGLGLVLRRGVRYRTDGSG